MSKVYQSPRAGQPLLTTISTGLKTPLLEVKFCNLYQPYYYPNSPTVPRRSITCVCHPETHKDFIKTIQTIEKNEKVDSIIKNETMRDEVDELVTTGNVLIKFQSKDLIPVYLGSENLKSAPTLIELQDELQKGEKVLVVFDILRYTKKNTMKTEHGISFKASCVYYFPSEKAG